MFGKKKVIEEWSNEDREYKRLNESMGEHIRTMITIIHDIRICEDCIRFLPESAEQNIEISQLIMHRKKLQNILSAYDEDYRAMNLLDKTKLIHFTCRNPNDAHYALHLAWELERK